MSRKLISIIGIVSALFLLGTATEATAQKLKRNSVKSAHIKDGQVRSADVRDGSLTGIDIQDGSLTADDLAPGTLQLGHEARFGMVEES